MPFPGIHRLRRHACLGSTPASEAGWLRRHADDAFRSTGAYATSRDNDQAQGTEATNKRNEYWHPSLTARVSLSLSPHEVVREEIQQAFDIR